MTLKVSFGKYDAHDKRANAVITKEWTGDWPELMERLVGHVPVTADKAEPGWVCGATFTEPHRHKDHFDKRWLISLDYDHIQPADVQRIISAYEKHAFLAYHTWSSTPLSPRLRVWMPLDRPVGADEYRAISRAVADRVGVELVDKASFAPAQYMYLPARPEGGEFQTWNSNGAPFISADGVLNEYLDWKDRKAWPRSQDESEPGSGERAQDPREKPGLIGEFCKKYSIPEAIEHFGLPYIHAGGDRWTYAHGSRAEGAIAYDDDTVLHSHHDTDPASGQHNAFDLVRLHRFGNLDVDQLDKPLADRPSQRAMLALAREHCPLQTTVVEYEALTDDPPVKRRRFELIPIGAFADGPPLEWIIDGVLPRAEFGLCYGPPGAGKTAIALSLAFAVATGNKWFDKTTKQGKVLYIAAEDAHGVKARCRAHGDINALNEWMLAIENAPDLSNPAEVNELLAEIKRLGDFSLVVLDTWSRVHSKDENSAADMNPVINACQLIYKQSGALVLGVHHVGKDATRGSRGSSALNGATNVELEVIRPDGGPRRFMSIRKMKNGPDGKSFPFQLIPQGGAVVAVPDKDGVTVESETDFESSTTEAETQTSEWEG